MLQDGIHDCTERMEQNIERQIVHRTWGRVHRLRVEVKEDRVIVHGCAASYYVKQLALEGAMDIVGGIGGSPVELDIDVALPRIVNSRYQEETPTRSASEDLE